MHDISSRPCLLSDSVLRFTFGTRSSWHSWTSPSSMLLLSCCQGKQLLLPGKIDTTQLNLMGLQMTQGLSTYGKGMRRMTIYVQPSFPWQQHHHGVTVLISSLPTLHYLDIDCPGRFLDASQDLACLELLPRICFLRVSAHENQKGYAWLFHAKYMLLCPQGQSACDTPVPASSHRSLRLVGSSIPHKYQPGPSSSAVSQWELHACFRAQTWVLARDRGLKAESIFPMDFSWISHGPLKVVVHPNFLSLKRYACLTGSQ